MTLIDRYNSFASNNKEFLTIDDFKESRLYKDIIANRGELSLGYINNQGFLMCIKCKEESMIVKSEGAKSFICLKCTSEIISIWNAKLEAESTNDFWTNISFDIYGIYGMNGELTEGITDMPPNILTSSITYPTKDFKANWRLELARSSISLDKDKEGLKNIAVDRVGSLYISNSSIYVICSTCRERIEFKYLLPWCNNCECSISLFYPALNMPKKLTDYYKKVYGVMGDKSE